MELSKIKSVQFIKTAIWPKDYPKLYRPNGTPMPEIAVVGRSNVGKSSVLNYLFDRKKLVKTSSSPGKTQTINFFSVNDEIGFVDLPGYGYAKVQQSIKKRWGPMVQSYLEKRDSLQLILFLFDIRRTPNDDDYQFLEWAAYFEKPLIIVLNKTDKLSKSQVIQKRKKISDLFEISEKEAVLFSAVKRVGRKELLQKIKRELSKECD